MRKFYNLILLLTILLSNELKAQVNTQDSLALVDLYNSTNGPHWYNHNGWLSNSPVSTWHGVTVTSNKVSYLYLGSNNLTGIIPSSIGKLTGLNNLRLEYNHLSGSIPDSIGYLTNLIEINFSANQLTGSIPSSIGNLSNLGTLILEANKLSGTIPSSFSKLNRLNILILDVNQLTGGITCLGKLDSIEDIDVAGNQLSGKIPIFNSPILGGLNLADNQFSGNIPVFRKDMSMFFLTINQNNLTGSLNNKFDSLPNLNILYLYNNQLTGKIPVSFNHLVYLNQLDVSGNQLSGDIPSLDSLTQLYQLHFDGNRFTFSGMENIASTFPFATYANQTNISITQNANVLSVSAGGTISNNTYKWYKNGVLFKTKTGNKNLTVNTNGNYSVAVTNSIATALTLYSDTVSVTNPLQQSSDASIATIKTNLSIYPNPVKTIATISFTATGNCIIKLTDLSGNVLQTKTMIGKGANTVQLDVSKYPEGVYFVCVINNRGELKTLQLNKE